MEPSFVQVLHRTVSRAVDVGISVTDSYDTRKQKRTTIFVVLATIFFGLVYGLGWELPYALNSPETLRPNLLFGALWTLSWTLLTLVSYFLYFKLKTQRICVILMCTAGTAWPLKYFLLSGCDGYLLSTDPYHLGLPCCCLWYLSGGTTRGQSIYLTLHLLVTFLFLVVFPLSLSSITPAYCPFNPPGDVLTSSPTIMVQATALFFITTVLLFIFIRRLTLQLSTQHFILQQNNLLLEELCQLLGCMDIDAAADLLRTFPTPSVTTPTLLHLHKLVESLAKFRPHLPDTLFGAYHIEQPLTEVTKEESQHKRRTSIQHPRGSPVTSRSLEDTYLYNSPRAVRASSNSTNDPITITAVTPCQHMRNGSLLSNTSETNNEGAAYDVPEPQPEPIVTPQCDSQDVEVMEEPLHVEEHTSPLNPTVSPLLPTTRTLTSPLRGFSRASLVEFAKIGTTKTWGSSSTTAYPKLNGTSSLASSCPPPHQLDPTDVGSCSGLFSIGGSATRMLTATRSTPTNPISTKHPHISNANTLGSSCSMYSTRSTIVQSQLNTGLQVKTVTILYANLANLNGLCYSRPQAEVETTLQMFYHIVISQAKANRGSVGWFGGGRAIISWNAPQHCATHAKEACDTALAILSRLKRTSTSHLPNCRIGIATGQLLVGNLGTSQVAYNYIGNGINLAHSLEQLSKILGTTGALISGNTGTIVKPFFRVRTVDNVTLVGSQGQSNMNEFLTSRASTTSAHNLHKMKAVYELLTVIEHCDDEWMYQLQAAEQGDGDIHAQYESAWKHLCCANFEAAVTEFQKLAPLPDFQGDANIQRLLRTAEYYQTHPQQFPQPYTRHIQLHPMWEEFPPPPSIRREPSTSSTASSSTTVPKNTTFIVLKPSSSTGSKPSKKE